MIIPGSFRLVIHQDSQITRGTSYLSHRCLGVNNKNDRNPQRRQDGEGTDAGTVGWFAKTVTVAVPNRSALCRTSRDMYGSVEQPRRLTDLMRGDTTEIVMPYAGGKFRASGRVSFAAWACVSIGMAWAIARNGWSNQSRSQFTPTVTEDEHQFLSSSNYADVSTAFSVLVTKWTMPTKHAKGTNFRQSVWADSAQTTLTQSAARIRFRMESPIVASVLRTSCSVTETLPPLGNRVPLRFHLVRPRSACDRKPPILAV